MVETQFSQLSKRTFHSCPNAFGKQTERAAKPVNRKCRVAIEDPFVVSFCWFSLGRSNGCFYVFLGFPWLLVVVFVLFSWLSLGKTERPAFSVHKTPRISALAGFSEPQRRPTVDISIIGPGSGAPFSVPPRRLLAGSRLCLVCSSPRAARQ